MCSKSWRKDLNSMKERMVTVMNNSIPDICHDVTFIVGNEKVEISCHKIFLAIASPVFEAMFSNRHNSKETSAAGGTGGDSVCNNNNAIILPDVHPDGLKNVIKYAYTGMFNVDVKDTLITMYAAHKYDIPELTKHCSEVLHKILSLANVVTIYQAALLLNDQNLAKSAWEFVETKAAVLLDSDEFLEFSGDNLRKFLSLDCIPNLRSEVEVFKALMKWGRLKCDQKALSNTKENMRSVLEPYLSLIRFPAMDSDEFNEEVVTSGVLNSTECIDLFKYFISYGGKRVGIGLTLNYPCKSRVDGKFVFCCAAINKTLGTTLPTSCDIFSITTETGNTATIKLKSIGIVLPSKSKNSKCQCVSVGLGDTSIDKWIHTAKAKVTKSLEISYIKIDPPVKEKKKVELVKFSKELVNQSTFTWNTAGKHQWKLDFLPNGYFIWALQFEY